jgi:RNA polymerase sigma-70 factor (ECF subfamily)
VTTPEGDPDDSGDNVNDLAAQAAAGDRAALDLLLRRIRPAVLRRCGSMLLYRADAEEACQDALLQVARAIHTFEGRSAFTTWLHVVVTNCVRETYRALRRRAADPAPAEILEQRPDPRTTSVIAGARIDLLDAAQRLGVPVSTARFRIHEARKFVRRHLTDGAVR